MSAWLIHDFVQFGLANREFLLRGVGTTQGVSVGVRIRIRIRIRVRVRVKD